MNKIVITMLEVATPSNPTASRDLGFAKGQAASFAANKGRKLVCTQGKLWVTRSGDPSDYILSMGESFSLDKALTVSALAPSFFRLER